MSSSALNSRKKLHLLANALTKLVSKFRSRHRKSDHFYELDRFPHSMVDLGPNDISVMLIEEAGVLSKLLSGSCVSLT